ncbi:MAG: class I SAM-dependent methyltransferase [Saprospiraceae bacterium]|nr:class I SAM-dependent methyltransferase [Saprospiraceae bacterium]
MDIDQRFSEDVIEYILNHENDDLYTLALKKSPFPGIEMRELVQQIQGRRIARKKFPFLVEHEKYFYPRKESLEQASSEVTANYKSTMVVGGSSFIDLTGGMGIDAYLLGRKFKRAVYVEPQPNLYQSSKYNYSILGFTQCEMIHSTCETYLDNSEEHFDWVYLDPSRRIDGERKTSITKYTPNIVALQEALATRGKNILVKLSPMQDISECVKELNGIIKIVVLSIHNEIKELLLHISPTTSKRPLISAIDISGECTSEFSFDFEHRHLKVDLAELQQYLYQPSPALIKAELHNRYSNMFSLKKIHQNTHLYVSDTLKEDFFGRIFRIIKNIRLSKKELKKVLPDMKANVISKNHPLKAKDIIKKYKIQSGGNNYLIVFTKAPFETAVVLCERIK